MVLALDRTGDRVGPPPISASLVLVGNSVRLAGRHLQAGGAHLERAQHQAEARQDQPAEETSPASSASTVTAVPTITTTPHGGVRRSRPPQDGCARADQRHPAVGAEARRVVVAVDDARPRPCVRHDPARRDVPAARSAPRRARRTPRRPPRSRASRRAAGRSAHAAFRQLVDRLEEHGAVAQRALPGRGARYRAHLRRVLPMSMARKDTCVRPLLRCSCPTPAGPRSR